MAGSSRKFDVLDGLFLSDDPFLPLGTAVLHGAQDDLRHLQPRITQTNYSAPQRVNVNVTSDLRGQ